MHPYTVGYLRHALFEHGTFEITPAKEFTDEDVDWGNVEAMRVQPVMFPNTGWQWLNEGKVVEGITSSLFSAPPCLSLLRYTLLYSSVCRK